MAAAWRGASLRVVLLDRVGAPRSQIGRVAEHHGAMNKNTDCGGDHADKIKASN